jgi:NAD(P)-dependent dehydrogenase (short-subunit alcohol dehydrogenase family)
MEVPREKLLGRQGFLRRVVCCHARHKNAIVLTRIREESPAKEREHMGSMSGQTAFITGAAGGIGRATAHALACEGVSLMLVDLDAAGLEITREEIARHGNGVAVSRTDIADAKAVEAAVDETVARFGRLDMAHNNAGLLGPIVDLVNYPLDKARTLFDVNVLGLLHCLQPQIRHMLQSGGGSIVNMASVSGVHAVPNISVYTATKHAVIGLTKAAAAEYSSRGIRVNCVCPGFVLTNMTKGHFNAETESILVAQHPIGRFAQPEEIAEAVVWLLSDRASFSAGSALFVDGGQTI